MTDPSSSRRRAKRGIALEVRAHVAQRPRDVLDVDRIVPRRRLMAEGAERLQIALHRHQVEPAPVLRKRLGRRLGRASELQIGRESARRRAPR